MALWDRVFGRREQPISYGTEPASPTLFFPRRRESVGVAERNGVRHAAPAGSVMLIQSVRLDGCLRGIGPVVADARCALVEFIGAAGQDRSVEIWSKAVAPDESRARRMLERVAVWHRGSYLKLTNAASWRGSRCQTELRVQCACERPISFRGVYSAVSLTDLSAGADVETTHGRVTLLNVCGAVAARAVNGILDYSGHEGSIRLYADWEINLDLDSTEFDGKLTAMPRDQCECSSRQDFPRHLKRGPPRMRHSFAGRISGTRFSAAKRMDASFIPSAKARRASGCFR